jgi:hypothetical protein
MFENFRAMSLETRQMWIMQWVMIGAVFLVFIPTYGPWLAILMVFIAFLINDDYIHRVKHSRLERHQGERYHDSFVVREKSYSQDMILSTRDKPISLGIFTVATKELLKSPEYKKYESVLLKKKEVLLLKLTRGMEQITPPVKQPSSLKPSKTPVVPSPKPTAVDPAPTSGVDVP